MHVDYAHCHQTTLSAPGNTFLLTQPVLASIWLLMYEDIDNYYLIQKFHMVYIEAVVD